MQKHLVVILLTLLHNQLYAQDSIKTESMIPRYMLPKIVVQAPRVPMDIWTSPLSVDVIGRAPGESLDPARNTMAELQISVFS
jgi:hypothetical protein